MFRLEGDIAINMDMDICDERPFNFNDITGVGEVEGPREGRLFCLLFVLGAKESLEVFEIDDDDAELARLHADADGSPNSDWTLTGT